MGYSLVGEDDEMFHVKDKHGSVFPIAKRAVGPEMHARIKGMAPINMAEGGIVPEPEVDADSDGYDDVDKLVDTRKPTETQYQPGFLEMDNPYRQDYGPAPTVAPAPVEAAPQPQSQVLPTQGPAPASLPASAEVPAPPIAQPSISGDVSRAFAQKEAGIQSMAQAHAQAGQDQAKIYEQQAKQAQELQQQYAVKQAELDAEHKKLFDAVTNHKVDSSRLWNNMSTGNKVLAAVSVALSGIGAGMQGQPGKNVALEVIQKAIDRDIDAQKAELGKKQTLLSENMRRYGNLQAATQATMLQYNAIAQANVSRVAASANSAQARAQARMLMGDLNLQAAAIKQSLAQQQVRQSIMNGGGLSDAQVQQLPDEDRKRLVKIGGKYAAALDNDSAKEARKVVGETEGFNRGIDELINLRQKYGAETIPGPEKARMQALAKYVQNTLRQSGGMGTLDKGSKDFLDEMVADPASVGFVLDRYKAIRDAQNMAASEKLRPLGINPSQLGAQSPQYKTVDGKRYMRGPNGEAIEVK